MTETLQCLPLVLWVKPTQILTIDCTQQVPTYLSHPSQMALDSPFTLGTVDFSAPLSARPKNIPLPSVQTALAMTSLIQSFTPNYEREAWCGLSDCFRGMTHSFVSHLVNSPVDYELYENTFFLIWGHFPSTQHKVYIQPIMADESNLSCFFIVTQWEREQGWRCGWTLGKEVEYLTGWCEAKEENFCCMPNPPMESVYSQRAK